MRVPRYTHARASKTRHLVIDNRLHLVVATTETSEQAERIAGLLSEDPTAL